MMQDLPVRLRREGAVAHLILARPQVRNAFNAEMISCLHEHLHTLEQQPDLRVVVLRGEGETFCAGADVAWMRESLDLTQAQNLADAEAMARMFAALDRLPVPIIARVQGAALGGGAGLLAACDIVIAADDAMFGFTETKLGLLPAVISPFVRAKIGASHLRALALSGERFNAAHAARIGLVHHVVPNTELDDALLRVINELLTASPSAIAAAKKLFTQLAAPHDERIIALTTQAGAAQRTSPEGQDGLRAFLEKRPPTWIR